MYYQIEIILKNVCENFPLFTYQTTAWVFFTTSNSNSNSNLSCIDQEVVFQCRDEGSARAKVHWERENGLPLKPGSRDERGRLEIPNIQLDQAGTYICVASDYPRNTLGAQVPVTLRVVKSKYKTVCSLDKM